MKKKIKWIDIVPDCMSVSSGEMWSLGFDCGYEKGFKNGQKINELDISFLRQWLNEDRITDPEKMVTNEQIKKWLK